MDDAGARAWVAGRTLRVLDATLSVQQEVLASVTALEAGPPSYWAWAPATSFTPDARFEPSFLELHGTL